MEILIKKGGAGDPSTASIHKLSELLEIGSIKNDIKKLISSLETLQSIPKLSKNDVLDMLIGEFLTKADIINLSQPGSIEKQKNIPKGIVYYNESLDKLRLNTKKGWIDLN